VGGCQSDRDHFVIATRYAPERKADPEILLNHRKNMRRSVEGSLQRLGTDHIDLLWLHMWDGMTPVDEVMRALDDLVRAGTVLYVGISDTPAWVVSQANMLSYGWSRFVAYRAVQPGQPRRSATSDDRSARPGFLAWGALEGGELTGKYNVPTDEPRRSKDTNDRIKKIASVLMEVASEAGRTPSQVAVNWVRQKPYHMIPILGARSEKQLMDNLGCLDFELTANNQSFEYGQSR
jgi:aryl-alcohol dehydrogenase-like predicted oxidoreductase